MIDFEWKNKYGDCIKMSEMDDNYLANLLSWMEKMNGKVVVSGGESNPNDFWIDEEKIDFADKIDCIKNEIRLRKIETRIGTRNV